MTEQERQIREAQGSFERLNHPDYEEPVTTIGYLLSLLDKEREGAKKAADILRKCSPCDSKGYYDWHVEEALKALGQDNV